MTSGPLALLCYEDNLRTEDWNDINRQARGVVLDLEARRTVARPFDKFFNLNEHPETHLENLPRSGKFEAAIKYDGSMVTVFWHAGQVQVVTRGAFDNIQVAKAREILRDRHSNLQGPVLEERTLVFELVSPELPNVVSYPNDELILTGIRDHRDGGMWSYSAVRTFAVEHGLGVLDIESGTLDAFAHRAKEEDLPDLTEGWVLRFENGHYVKLKRWQYVAHVKIDSLRLGNRHLTHRYCTSTPAQWEELLADLPACVRPAVAAWGHEVQGQIDAVAVLAAQRLEPFGAISSAKDFAEAIRREIPSHWQPLMYILRSGKSAEPSIRKFYERFLPSVAQPPAVTPAMLREWAFEIKDV